MTQVYEATKQGHIQMFREAFAHARARGDAGMIRAMNVELATLGVFETAQGPELELAVPEKPRRGRRPLPRCEHDMILARCPTCSPEEMV
jgi:hypothetical protein